MVGHRPTLRRLTGVPQAEGFYSNLFQSLDDSRRYARSRARAASRWRCTNKAFGNLAPCNHDLVAHVRLLDLPPRLLELGGLGPVGNESHGTCGGVQRRVAGARIRLPCPATGSFAHESIGLKYTPWLIRTVLEVVPSCR